MKYCKKTTESHSLSSKFPECIIPIARELVKEGGRGADFGNDCLCIDMDGVEKTEKRSSPMATMDMAMGISHKTSRNEGGFIKEVIKSPQMLLVEFKFNCKSPANIKLKEIRDKIKGSKEWLGNEIAICNDYVFIFQSATKNVAISYFSRLSVNRFPCLIMDIDEFYCKYFR